MAHSLTLVEAGAPSITVPDDGDDLEAVSVETPFQSVGNWLQWVHNRLTGLSILAGSPSINGSLSVTGNISTATFTATSLATFNNSLQVIGGTVTLVPLVNAIGGVTANGNISTNGTLTASGIITGGSHIQAGGNVDAVGAVNGGAASRIPKRVVNGPNATQTIVAADADIWIVTLSADRTWTLSTANAIQGDVCAMHNDTPASYNLNIEAGAEDCSILPGGVATYVFHGGIWRLLSIV